MNHLHLHILYPSRARARDDSCSNGFNGFPVESAAVKKTITSGVTRLEWPLPCFSFTNRRLTGSIVEMFIEYLNEQRIPHSVLFIPGPQIRVIVAPRRPQHAFDIQSAGFNAAVCEVFGLVIAHSQERFESVSESLVVNALATQAACEDVVMDRLELFLKHVSTSHEPNTEMKPLAVEEGFEDKLLQMLDTQFPHSGGHDSEGVVYESITEFWELEMERADDEEDDEAESGNAYIPPWYNDANEYWDQCPPTDDGVLGGFGHISPVDLEASSDFLAQLYTKRPELGRTKAVDCGAGIGRVTKHLLLPRFSEVHLLEQSPMLIRAAPSYLGESDLARTKLVCTGMQAFDPPPSTYDVVWIQWAIGHLTDSDLVMFLVRIEASLKRGGVIIVKDNCLGKNSDGIFYVDRDDSSVTRNKDYLISLFTHAGLKVVLDVTQMDFPSDLFPVHMLALSK